jgi:thioredoxin reductase (NADPH)
MLKSESAELKETQIFFCLNEAELLWLSQHTADVHLEPGDYLIHEGEPTSFFVLLEGTTEVTKGLNLDDGKLPGKSRNRQ